MNLLLHIGVSKTGSTAIQRSIDANAGVQNGYYLPNAADLPFVHNGHHKGLAYLASSRRLWEYGRHMLEHMFEGQDITTVNSVLENDISTYRDVYMSALCQLVEKVKYLNCHTIVLSTELLSEVTNADSITAFCHLLDPIFNQKRVLVYVRDQPYAYISLYAQNIKGGAKFSFEKFNRVSGVASVYDYDDLIKKWSTCGWNVSPRIYYERHNKPENWNILADFESAVCGESDVIFSRKPAVIYGRHNVSPNADTLWLFRLFNYIGLSGKMIRFQYVIWRIVRFLWRGDSCFLRYNRQHIDKIRLRHKLGNEIVANCFFNREKLFE